MVDKTTKALLLAIAIGLWANIAAQWTNPVQAQDIGTTQMVIGLQSIASELRSIESSVSSINSDLGRIQLGSCTNSTIY